MKKRGKSFTVEEIKKIFLEFNKLFEIIQEKKIIHRDIKLQNFLVKFTDKKEKEFLVKLSDYGLGKVKSLSNSFSGLKGSLETVAPEILFHKTTKYESTVDIFSLGIILYQMSHNLKHPFDVSKTNYLLLVIKYNNNYDEDDFQISFDSTIHDKNFKDLIEKMLKINPKNRISWKEYFKHPFFR